ncbi:hypothetical protein HCDG_00262 [Histoplasma capsulatum H143]|uniref:Uncharacterized protein n=1 Tax=Ajellomyces capsulatus (strain H143) TaxID=544712 RepID=C6H4R1_AJECH|nr:hypothetical protein HCDG_00262 [Histoplasma capsulatum H143]
MSSLVGDVWTTGLVRVFRRQQAALFSIVPTIHDVLLPRTRQVENLFL